MSVFLSRTAAHNPRASASVASSSRLVISAPVLADTVLADTVLADTVLAGAVLTVADMVGVSAIWSGSGDCPSHPAALVIRCATGRRGCGDRREEGEGAGKMTARGGQRGKDDGDGPTNALETFAEELKAQRE